MSDIEWQKHANQSVGLICMREKFARKHLLSESSLFAGFMHDVKKRYVVNTPISVLFVSGGVFFVVAHAQCTVFPWGLKTHSNKALSLDDLGAYSDLAKPIGVLDVRGFAYLKERMNGMPADDQFLYGTHYFFCV